MDARQTRYCFVFHYGYSSSFCTGADTLAEARQIFKSYINAGPRHSKNERRRLYYEKRHKILSRIDINLIEPEIYAD